MERPPWVARVLSAGGEVLGAGCLVSLREVLTCAHVLPEGDGERAGLQVELTFGPTGPHPVEVAADSVVPQAADGSGDLAVLRLLTPLPAGNAEPAEFDEPKNGEFLDRRFITYGYPAGYPYGTTAVGVVRGAAGPALIQLQSETDFGQAVEHGFSGAAVFDPALERVLGIVVSKDTSADRRIGYMLPTREIERHIPNLRVLGLGGVDGNVRQRGASAPEAAQQPAAKDGLTAGQTESQAGTRGRNVATGAVYELDGARARMLHTAHEDFATRLNPFVCEVAADDYDSGVALLGLALQGLQRARRPAPLEPPPSDPGELR